MRIELDYGEPDAGQVHKVPVTFDGAWSGDLWISAGERETVEGILRRGCGKKHTLIISGFGALEANDPQPGLFDNAPPD